MSSNFEWHIEDAPKEDNDKQADGWPLFRPAALLVFVLVIAAGAATFFFVRYQLDRQRQLLATELQELIDLSVSAVSDGDGELLLSLQIDDPAWHAELLGRSAIELLQSEPKVFSARRLDDYALAEIGWQGSGDLRRLLFFKENESSYVGSSPAPSFWGDVTREATSWGRIVFWEGDEEWIEAIVSHVDDEIGRLCQARCRQDHLPLTLVLADDFQLTVESGQVRVPSPFLVAFDPEQGPGEPYWELLDKRIMDHLAPAVIRFAVADSEFDRYVEFALEYGKRAQGYTVEIVPFSEAGVDLSMEIPEGIDGAAIAPDLSMLAGGQVLDLTDLMHSDEGFESAEFYEQIFGAAWWRDRMWMVPQRATFPLMFFNPAALETVGAPSSDEPWNWNSLERYASELPNIGQQAGVDWAFMLADRDILLSIGYGADRRCGDEPLSRCARRLTARGREEALEWYRRMIEHPEKMIDQSGMSESERERYVLDSRGNIVFWLGKPVSYEDAFLLWRIEAHTLPFNDEGELVVPLWVDGSYISSKSERPRVMWSWLRYVSNQSVNRQYRYVPSRKSVADDTDYWAVLPEVLSKVMSESFAVGQPVYFADRNAFDWATINMATEGELATFNAARSEPRLPWFSAAR